MKSQLSTNLGLPLIDLADAPPRPGAHRHAIVDQVEGYYLGQPDTLLLEDGRTIHAGTYNGNPIGVAAAIATIGILSEPGTFDRMHRHGNAIRETIEKASAACGQKLVTTGTGAAFREAKSVK